MNTELTSKSGPLAGPVHDGVLHIDGDGDAALVLATLLAPEMVVTHVDSLAQASAALDSGRYALVVLDPDLPDGDGASLLAALGRSGAPVLQYSARAPDAESRSHGLAPAAFLAKPRTSPRQLWQTVAGLLGMAVVAGATIA